MLLSLLCIFLIGCTNETEDNDWVLSEGMFSGTTWLGVFSEKGAIKYVVVFDFINRNNSFYQIAEYKKDEDFGPFYLLKYNFTEDNILSIDTEEDIITGDWNVTGKKKKKQEITFERRATADGNKAVLRITKLF